MTLIFKLICPLFLVANVSFAQNVKTFDRNKITSTSKLNFATTSNRGIKSKSGIIYYVENDLQTLTAYENGKVKWQTNIITTYGRPAVGQPAVRYIKLEKQRVNVIFGKHSSASVDINNGNTQYLGAD